MSATIAGVSPVRVQAGAATRLRDRALGWRDRMLASPAFRGWATAFPLTRPVARRRARALFDLCAGFVYSQVLTAFVQLDVAGELAGGPLDAETLAGRLHLSVDSTDRLMRAACALRLAEPRGQGRFGLGALGAALLGNPGIAAMVEHHAMLYGDLRDPVSLLRGEQGERADTALARYWPYHGDSATDALPAERFAPYTALMAASQPMVAAEVLAAFDVSRHGCLLDVGGGDGSFLAAALTHAPRLCGKLFDLPAVADSARARLNAAGLGSRAETTGGDFRKCPLPMGADLVTFVRVLHDHDDATVNTLLRAAHAALPQGGTLLVAEPMAETRGAEPIGDAYFGFYLLAMGSGRPRSAETLAAMVEAAGFERPRLLRTRTPLLISAIVARRCKS